jgi:SAM-dependent methyltransferase
MDRLLEATYHAEQQHFWFRGFRRFVRPLVQEACRGIRSPRLLDCGCGTGRNLKLLSEFGRAFGFDLTARGLEFGRASGLSRLARASVMAIPFASSHFDVATSFDVLYCLEEPEEAQALSEMHRVLTPGGAIIINVAALDMLRGQHSLFGGEVRRYNRAQLKASVERAGFTISRLTYTNATIFPLVAAVRWLQRRGNDGGPDQVSQDIEVPSAPVNLALTGALALESVALRLVDMPFGSSLLCLARKTS